MGGRKDVYIVILKHSGHPFYMHGIISSWYVSTSRAISSYPHKDKVISKEVVLKHFHCLFLHALVR